MLLVNRPVNETNGFLIQLPKTIRTIQVCDGFRDDLSARQQTEPSHSWEVRGICILFLLLFQSVGPSAFPIVLFVE